MLGADMQAQQDAELAALNAEAEMPLEELLAAYKTMLDAEGTDEDEDTMAVTALEAPADGESVHHHTDWRNRVFFSSVRATEG